jgi:hypothetical protein
LVFELSPDVFDLGRATAARFVCVTVSSCSASAA